MTSTPSIRKPRRGDRFEVELVGYDRRGRALGRSDEYVVTLGGGVPGDRWSFEVQKRRRDQLEGRALALLEPGAARVPARCEHAKYCGGCSFQECDYETQLAWKRELVREAFVNADLPRVCEVEPVLGCADPFAYRNKMEFTFGNRRWIAPGEPAGVVADFALGLHARGLFSKVIDLKQCSIVFERGERILLTVAELARKHALPLWDVKQHVGFLRHLVLREGTNTGDVMVVIVTFDESPERFDPLAAELLERHPEITTLIQSIHSGPASVAYGERERIVHGTGSIEELLLGVRFRVSARSFFQTNTKQAERLMAIVREEAATSGDEVVYDLYSGAGTIALVLAPRVREVLGFEQVAQAVADARENAERNSMTNVRFFEGDVLAQLDLALTPKLTAPSSTLPRPDVCIVDPPRSGLHPKVPGKLLELGAKRIVYISCNIQNGAKDMAQLVQGGYRVERIRPVDLFPHTPHVECVVTLVREDAPLP